MLVQPVITPMGPYHLHPIIRAIQQVVRTAPAAELGIHALLMVTVAGALDTRIEAHVRTKPGNRRTAGQHAKTVRSRPTSRRPFTFHKDLADNILVAINIFSNIYPCPLNNGSYASSWCCGAEEGYEAKAGCCKGELFTPDFGSLTIPWPETEDNTTDMSSLTFTASSSSSFCILQLP